MARTTDVTVATSIFYERGFDADGRDALLVFLYERKDGAMIIESTTLIGVIPIPIPPTPLAPQRERAVARGPVGADVRAALNF